MHLRRTCALLGFILILTAAADAPAQKDAPSLEATLAWIKKVDGELTKPRYAALTLEQLKNLQELQLGGHRKSDNKHLFVKPDEFRNLAPLTGLKKLHLGENDGATDEALVHVGKLTGLNELVLWDAPMTDAGVKHLANLKDLTRLDLAFATKLTDAALEEIVKLPNLEFLNVAGTKVTDVSSLQKLTKLKELRVGKAKPKGLDELKKKVAGLVVK
jgi:Leucine-rich repeat (LRR) protein